MQPLLVAALAAALLQGASADGAGYVVADAAGSVRFISAGIVVVPSLQRRA